MIPITIVDDFLDEPHQLIELSKNLEFKTDKDGRWPGSRTEEIHTIDELLYNNITTKIMALFHPMRDAKETDLDCSMSFQKVPAKMNHGWVHNDNCFATGILYLNENPLVNSGTSCYTSKEGTLIDMSTTETKRKCNKKGFMDESDLQIQEKYNSVFQKDVDIRGKFNRLTLMHGNVHHSANSFAVDDDEDRLTLVMFFHRIAGQPMPLDRMRTVRKV